MSALPAHSNAADPAHAESRDAYYQRMARHHLFPLWESLHALVPRQPAPRAVPALWRYDEIRPFVMEAGRSITAEEAVRRVLILENPGCRGSRASPRRCMPGCS